MNQLAAHALYLTAALPLLASGTLAQTLLEVQPIEAALLPTFDPSLTGAFEVDFDVDGDGDVVVSELNSAVIYRRQAGTFVRQVIATGVGGTGFLFTARDLDADGYIDLVVGASGSPFQAWLTVHWGDGSGQLPAASTTNVLIPLDAWHGRIAAGDVDADNDLDLVVTAQPPSGVFGAVLLRNQGNRTYLQAPGVQFPAAGSGDSKPFLVDVDGDGALDIVLVSRTGVTRLFWNNGGNFAAATTAEFPLLQLKLRELVLGDFDGDGDKDLVLGGDGDQGVLLRTTGPRQLTLDASAPTGRRTIRMLSADVDGDLDLDLHVFSRDQGYLMVNDGTGHFALADTYGGTEDVAHVIGLDIDEDGDTDFLRLGFGTATAPATVSWTAAYTIRPGVLDYDGASRMPISSTSTTFATGDIDGNGLADVVVASGGTTQFAANDGRGVFSYRWAQRTSLSLNGFFADLTGDGRDEYVFTGPAPAGVLSNTGGELATTATPLPIGASGDAPAGTGLDVDGDGDQDLAFALRLGTYQALRIVMNHGSSWVEESATRVVGPVAAGQYPSVHAADLDGDGDLDVWLHTESEEQIWRNTAGVFTYVPAGVPINGWGGDNASFGDLDGDGDIDLHASRIVMRNQGNGTFVASSAWVPNTFENENLRLSADVDDDGDLDLVGGAAVVWNNGLGVFSQATGVLPFVSGSGSGVVSMSDMDLDGDPDAIAVANNRPLVLINQLRQLRMDSPVLQGGSITFRLRMRPGETPTPIAAFFVCSFSQIDPLMVPGIGWVQVDPAQFFPLGAYVLPAAGGDVVHQEPVPVDPTLHGRFFCAQPLELRGDRIRLGNLVSTWIDR